ncbi:MAG TPA: molybdopterin molybdenumtransferase MoeA, partial [Alphaproteobacteria bacterium]|nr:molybdopterin molybdenumtransferase MoeA [Alphaproteobacteria bacterium]
MTDHPEALAPELGLDAAQSRLDNLITPIQQMEDWPLHLCHGAILGQDMVSPINVPPSDTAAVDGYAFRHADLIANLEHA